MRNSRSADPDSNKKNKPAQFKGEKAAKPIESKQKKSAPSKPAVEVPIAAFTKGKKAHFDEELNAPIEPKPVNQKKKDKQEKNKLKKQSDHSAKVKDKKFTGKPFPKAKEAKKSFEKKAAPTPVLAPPKKAAQAEEIAEPPTLLDTLAVWSSKLTKLLTDPNYQPLDFSGLVRKLSVDEAAQPSLTKFLFDEEMAGRIMQVRSGLYVLPMRLGLSAGHLQMNERGFGFFVSINPVEPDFYVGAEDTSTALHGDFCLARLKNLGKRRDERLRGEIVKVLRRKRSQLVGTLMKTPMFFYVVPDESRIKHDIYVAPPADLKALGNKVVVELKEWLDATKHPEGLVTEVLGLPGAPGVDLLSIIRKHDLPTSFPEEVEQAAADISAAISPEELARREDFRSIFTLTIDPDDAKDFDDALSYKRHANGDFEIFVHIADVSHFVVPSSPLDIEARSRGNSVYLVDRVLPMLPEKLSNGICSLQPEVDRLVKTAIVTLDAKGRVKSTRFAQGVIHSQKRLTYKEAWALLQKPTKTPVSQHLHALDQMAQILRANRRKEGALDLDFPEVKVRVNELGIPVGLERVENDRSHQLIEEFMLLANDVVAYELKSRDRAGVYRVHENPDPAKLEEFRATVQAMGFASGDLTHRAEVQKLLDRVAGKPGESVVKIGLLRSLKRAMYSTKPLGHYGLAKTNYTHFTSPIRRYADLLVHRLLFQAKAGLSVEELSQTTLHLSNTERVAAEAEQESVKLKKLEYFDRQARASQRSSFAAVILEIRTNGLVVELPEFVIQGRVKLSSLEGELFDFNVQRQELKGQRSGVILRPGTNITVEVEKVDLALRQVDFAVKKASIMKLSRSS